MPDARLWLSSRCLSSSSEETIHVMYSFDDVHILKFDGSQSDKNKVYSFEEVEVEDTFDYTIFLFTQYNCGKLYI